MNLLTDLPTLSSDDFKHRRATLAQKMGKNAIAIITTRAEMYRNRDADYKYRPESSFYYLTGFAEPEAVAVIEIFEQEGEYRYTLFCRERNREMEIWTGLRAGIDGAVTQYGADEAFVIDDLDNKIIEKLSKKSTLYYRIAHDKKFDSQVSSWLATLNQRQGESAPEQLKSLDVILDEMRLIKSSAEIEMMRTAAKISAYAHTRAMQMVRPEMWEYQLEAEIQYVFGQYGCVPSYNSIVGGGANACILHYVDNNQRLKSGDLVLIDAGCEYQYYAGDITRTFPVNGHFSGEQKALYELVLMAQKTAIELTKIGHHYRQPHEQVCRILTQGLLDLGLLKGELNELVETEQYRQFYMHGTGHWLGMDVHDVGQYKLNDEWRPYQAGMVVTVEPGLYIAPDNDNVDARWRGIGIRIEDDVLLTEQGVEVLTADVVKSVDDIEHLMAQA